MNEFIKGEIIVIYAKWSEAEGKKEKKKEKRMWSK